MLRRPQDRGERSEDPNPNQRWNLKRTAARMAILVTIGSSFGGSWAYFNRNESEETVAIGPTPSKTQQDPKDRILKVTTWNMHRNASAHEREIDQIMRTNDALMMQEVTGDDIQQLTKSLHPKQKLYITYKKADAKQVPIKGGLHNVIITTKPPIDTDSKRIKGGSMLETVTKTTEGVIDDVTHTDSSLPESRKGLLENRAILSVTTRAIGNIAVRFVTTHIAHGPPSAHKPQMKQVLSYSEKAAQEGDMPVVIGADLNEPNLENIVVPFGKIGYITREVRTPTTIPKRGQPATRIDNIIYYPGDKLGLMKTRTNNRYKTDHIAVQGEVALAEQP